MPSPAGVFWTARLLRPLVLCIFDILIAFAIYASATNRFLLFSAASDYDPDVARRKREQALVQTNLSLQMAQTKLRAFSVARNAVVRDQTLKSTDDEYWRAVVAMEGVNGGQGVWEDDEVQAAIARALGGGVDVTQVGKDADAFISNITRGLEDNA